jgi:hypothetical protein
MMDQGLALWQGIGVTGLCSAMPQVLLENCSPGFFGRSSFLDFINVTTMYDTRTSRHD